MPDNHYAVLGISRTTNAGGIRQAFKERALRFHPDRAGAAATEAFQRISEAYRVLGNPDSRAEYDRQLREPGWRRTSLEPFSARARGSMAVELEIQPEPELELILSRDEALHGGRVFLRVPVHATCSVCDGSGWTLFFPCLACAGQGNIGEEITAIIRLPPRLFDGVVLEISSDLLPRRNQTLRMQVRILR